MKTSWSLRTLIGSRSPPVARSPSRRGPTAPSSTSSRSPPAANPISPRGCRPQMFKAKYGKEMVVVNKPGAGGGLAWSQMNNTPGDGYTITGVNLPHIVLQPLEADAPTSRPRTSPPSTSSTTRRTRSSSRPTARSRRSTTSSRRRARSPRPSPSRARAPTPRITPRGRASIATSRSRRRTCRSRAPATCSRRSSAVTCRRRCRTPRSRSSRRARCACSRSRATKRLPQFPDVPTFRELGVDWVDGAYRGVGVPKSTPPEIRKQVSDMMDAINKDPEPRTQDVRARVRGHRHRLRPDAEVPEGARRRIHELGQGARAREVGSAVNAMAHLFALLASAAMPAYTAYKYLAYAHAPGEFDDAYSEALATLSSRNFRCASSPRCSPPSAASTGRCGAGFWSSSSRWRSLRASADLDARLRLGDGRRSSVGRS